MIPEITKVKIESIFQFDQSVCLGRVKTDTVGIHELEVKFNCYCTQTKEKWPINSYKAIQHMAI